MKGRTLTMSNGVQIPMIGMGTFPFKGEMAYSLFKDAWELGYRSFDTAWAYKNEVDIGLLIKQLRINREDVFLTSKLHINDLYWPRYYYSIGGFRYKSIMRAYEGSCRRLGVDYLDLYLIHWPFPGFQGMWKELVRLYDMGRVRAIGVCACLQKHLDSLFDCSGRLPHVNQIELNPYNSRLDIVDYCQDRGIIVEANSPLGGGVFTKELLSESVIRDLAGRYNVSPSQIVLRWMVQRNVVVIPRSGDKNRLQQNLSLFDFALTDLEINQINHLNQDLFIRGDARRVGIDGRYK